MVYSQAVLEHVDDLATTYAALAEWLKPGGVASHQVGFVSHGITPEWNGHWTISDPVWKLIRGRRPYLLNREPASTHARMLRDSGLEVVNEVRVHKPSDIARSRLASPIPAWLEARIARSSTSTFRAAPALCFRSSATGAVPVGRNSFAPSRCGRTWRTSATPRA